MKYPNYLGQFEYNPMKTYAINVEDIKKSQDTKNMIIGTASVVLIIVISLAIIKKKKKKK